MMGPDYTHWHGTYEVAKHFYSEFIPALEKAFRGPLDPRVRFVTGGSSAEGIFRIGTSAVVVEGDPAPQTGGASFTGFGTIAGGKPATNTRGEVAFFASNDAFTGKNGIYLATGGKIGAFALGCRARRACPVGAQLGYDQPQARFHMAAFAAARRREQAA